MVQMPSVLWTAQAVDKKKLLRVRAIAVAGENYRKNFARLMIFTAPI
jgi:hypothetical protein